MGLILMELISLGLKLMGKQVKAASFTVKKVGQSSPYIRHHPKPSTRNPGYSTLTAKPQTLST